MKQGILIALLLAIALAWAGMAHDHPPPTDCPSTCVDRQCHCVDACNKSESAGQECFKDCYDRKQECLSRCSSMSEDDCRNTDRCSRPRG